MPDLIRAFVSVKAAAFVVALIAVALLATGDGHHIRLDHLMQFPGDARAPLGYDELGRSILPRIAQGLLLAIEIAFFVVLLALGFGSLVGLISGYFGGWADNLIMRVIDVFLAFPGLLLAIALAAILGPGVGNLVIALAAVSWVSYARLVRAQTLSIKHNDHIAAARAFNVATWRIWLLHILPLTATTLSVEATFGFATAILSEAGLSFLGIGVQPPTASLGQMIREGARYMLVAPHLVIFPSLTLWLLIWGINHAGEKIRRSCTHQAAE